METIVSGRQQNNQLTKLIKMMFKKITALAVLAMLCLSFKAQAQENKVTDTAKSIEVGQPVPDVTIASIHNYKTKTAKISDFKGKLLILDFWATWCGPCIGMVPKMDSLQKVFGNEMQFLSVTYQNEKEVLPFLEKLEMEHNKHYNLPHVVADKELHKLFPHRVLPHYVWIDKGGKLLSITGVYEVTGENIKKAINQDAANMEQKADVMVKYDRKSPLFSHEAFRKGVVMQATISGYIEGIGGGMSQNVYLKDTGIIKKITVRNISMPRIYAIAYGKGEGIIGKNRIILKVADTSNLRTDKKGEEMKEWQKKNTFCYELIIPTVIQDKAWDYMKSDLDRFFYKYSVAFEKYKTRCYALVRTSNNDKVSSKSSTTDKAFVKMDRDGALLKNAFLNRFISELNLLYQQNSPYPLMDDTGITSTVDIDVKANLSSIKEINKALKAYDLEFIEADREVAMLVIKDRL